MSSMQETLVISLSVLSVAFFVFGVYSLIKQITKHRGKTATQKLYLPTLCVFVSIFLLRYATAFHYIIAASNGNDSGVINWIEGLFNSLVHTLQTFSLDEAYTDTIVVVREIFANEFGSVFFAEFFGFFTSLLNIIAPVAGGAFLLGVLTSAFPRLSLLLRPFRKKYVFSELNEKAVLLAEDIVREALKEKKRRKSLFSKLPQIVFSDVYVGNDDELSSELLHRAKELGAICIKDDILTIRFIRTKELFYLLLDEEDLSNIHTLTTLTTEKEKRWNSKCNTHIYVFSNNAAIGSIIKKIHRKYKLELSNVVIKVVKEYTSVIYNLFHDVPLYYPLLTKYSPSFSDEKELVVTIIGSGHISTEAFLGAYWCGQMLDCRLRVSVITKDEEEYKSRINRINAEILQSGTFDGKVNKELLRIYPRQELYSSPYASFSFASYGINPSGIIDALVSKDNNGIMMLNSDYFIIALDSDEDNMSIANEINRTVTKINTGAQTNRKSVVAYALHDSNINKALNDFNVHDIGTYLHAFAALRDIYSCRNVFMKHIGDTAFNVSKIHTKQEMESFLKDEYNWWSSIARVLHRAYKVYSVGLLTPRDNPKMITEEENENYWRIIDSEAETDKEVCIRLAWLEHRRWNAFLRINGFTAPSESQWKRYAYQNPESGITHKHLELKLHPCIVECSEKLQITDSDWDNEAYTENPHLDCLDIVSIMVYQKQAELFGKKDKNDYKIWDYPKMDKR